MTLCQVAAAGGSLCAIFAGLGTSVFSTLSVTPYAVFAQQSQNVPLPPMTANSASTAGLIVAVSGLSVALGGQLFPFFKLWIETKAASDKAKWDRHDLLERFNIFKLEYEDNKAKLEQVTTENRRLIALLADAHIGPTPKNPDPIASIQKAHDSGFFPAVSVEQIIETKNGGNGGGKTE